MEVKKHDAVIGDYILRSHDRIKRYSIKITADGVVALMPLNGSVKKMTDFLEQSRKGILKHLESKKEKRIPLLDTTTRLEGVNFVLTIQAEDRRDFVIKQDGLSAFIIKCPQSADLSKPNNQQILRQGVENVLKYAGQHYLPGKLAALAKAHGFTYTKGRVSKSTSRWGSCSTAGTISLSASLMLLPEHLIDFIILHELTHTNHPNHSPDFHAALDRLLGGKEKELEAEIKKYTTWKVEL